MLQRYGKKSNLPNKKCVLIVKIVILKDLSTFFAKNADIRLKFL